MMVVVVNVYGMNSVMYGTFLWLGFVIPNVDAA